MKKYSSIRYYLLFLYYKMRIVIDCSEGRMNMILSECIHLLAVLIGTWIEMPEKNHIQTVTTLWGRFHFIGDLYSYLIMNPSFERADMEYFASCMKNAIEKKEKILFLDIGANVGLYSVGMNRIVQSNYMTTHAFEPDPVYYELLRQNVRENKIAYVTIHNIALGNKKRDIHVPGFVMKDKEVCKTQVKFHVQTLDSLLSSLHVSRFDYMFIKIDIEGHEEEAIRGAEKLFFYHIPTLLMIEDCVNPTIVSYLMSHGFVYRGKITPYNSFWELPTTHETKTKRT